MRLEQQLAAANDLQQRLEKQIERLRIEAAQADSTSHQVGSRQVYNSYLRPWLNDIDSTYKN